MKSKIFISVAAVWSVIAIVFLVIGREAGEARWTATLLMSFWGFPSTLLIPRWLVPTMDELNIGWFRSDGSVAKFFVS